MVTVTGSERPVAFTFGLSPVSVFSPTRLLDSFPRCTRQHFIYSVSLSLLVSQYIHSLVFENGILKSLTFDVLLSLRSIPTLFFFYPFILPYKDKVNDRANIFISSAYFLSLYSVKEILIQNFNKVCHQLV